MRPEIYPDDKVTKFFSDGFPLCTTRKQLKVLDQKFKDHRNEYAHSEEIDSY
jgi:hypothetical protein